MTNPARLLIAACPLLMCTLALVSTPAAGQTGRESDVAISLESLERLKFGAQQSKDNSALNAMLDDSAMLVDQDGTLRSKAEYLAGLRQSASTLQQIVPESMKVIVFEQIAVVVGTYREKGVEANQPYHRRCRFMDTWAFKKGRWVCIASTATSNVK